jgi:hypothetical protein
MANATQNTFDPTVELNKIMGGNIDELDKAMGVPPGGSVLTVSLTANLYHAADHFNKNALVVTCERRGSLARICLTTMMMKDRPSTDEPPERQEETMIIDVESGWPDAITRIVMLCREMDALTDMNLNTLGNPLFSQEAQQQVFEDEIGDALMDFSHFSQQDFACLIQALTGSAQNKIEVEA